MHSLIANDAPLESQEDMDHMLNLPMREATGNAMSAVTSELDLSHRTDTDGPSVFGSFHKTWSEPAVELVRMPRARKDIDFDKLRHLGAIT